MPDGGDDDAVDDVDCHDDDDVDEEDEDAAEVFKNFFLSDSNRLSMN